MTQPPPYPAGHDLLAGKTVVVTAAAGTGIGFATARRCAEEGAIVAISDRHVRRLAESASIFVITAKKSSCMQKAWLNHMKPMIFFTKKTSWSIGIGTTAAIGFTMN